MNVLVWGGDSWANRGDDAVLGGTLVALRAKVPGARIVVASDRPVIRRARPAMLWELIRADVVLWGGGMLIQNQSSKTFLLVQLLFVGFALLLGKSVVCYGQGVGPVKGRLFRLALRFVLSRLAAVTVRDRPSARRLGALGIHAEVFADPSFCVPGSPMASLAPPPDCHVAHHAFLTPPAPRNDKPFIAVTLRRWGHYRGGWLPVRWARAGSSAEFERFCQEIAAALDLLPARVLFVPMCPGGDQGDDEVAEKVRRLMRRETTVLEEPLSAAQLKGLLGQAEMVIAMRTHAGILAAGAGTPVLSISYQGKGRAFMSELGLSEYCVPWQQVTADRLGAVAQRLWCERAMVRAHLRQLAPEMRASAFSNAEVVAGLPWSALYSGHGRLARLVQERRRMALELLAPQAGEHVLDLGCGIGAFRDGAEARGSDWVGVDIMHGPVRGDLRALPVADGAVCSALAIGVLDYLDLCPALTEMSRVLRWGGRAVVSYNGRWWGRAVRDRMPWTGVRSGAVRNHTQAMGPALAGAGLRIDQEVRVRGGLMSPDTTLLLVRKALREPQGTA